MGFLLSSTAFSSILTNKYHQHPFHYCRVNFDNKIMMTIITTARDMAGIKK